MRIHVTMDLFLNPEVLNVSKLDKNLAVSTIGAVLEEAICELGELVYASSTEVEVLKEGPDAAN